MGKHLQPFGVTTPLWTAENQTDLERWVANNLALDPQHLEEFQAVYNAYNTARVLRGWSVLSERAVSGLLRNLGFEFWKLADTRRQGIKGYRLKG